MKIRYVTTYNVLDVQRMLKLLYEQQYESIEEALTTLQTAYEQLKPEEKQVFEHDDFNDVEVAINYFIHLNHTA